MIEVSYNLKTIIRDAIAAYRERTVAEQAKAKALQDMADKMK